MRLTVILFTLVLLSNFTLFSQKEDIQFEHLSMRDGLSMNPVMAIAQDQKGFLWFGTQDGLNRYDGYSFKVFKYTEDDPASISDNFITALQVDSAGRLWIGTLSGGLNCFDYSKPGFTRFNSANSGLPSDRIFSLSKDNQETIWVGTEKGLCVVRSTSPEKLSAPGNAQNDPVFDELNSKLILCVFHDSKNNVWIGTTEGLYLRKDQSTATKRYRQGDLTNDLVLSVFEDRDHTIWVGTIDGLNKVIAEDTFKPYYFKARAGNENNGGDKSSTIKNIYSVVNNYGGNTIRTILQDKTGNLWIGTDMELIIFNPSNETYVNFKKDLINPTGINDHFIRSMYIDQSEVLWIGTLGNGINKTDLKPKKFRHYQKKINDPTSLSENYVRAITEGQDGKIWVGTLVGGLNLFDPKTEKFTTFFPNGKNDGTTPGDNNVWSLCYENENTLWIGTNRGLNRLDLSTGKYSYYEHTENQPGSLSENTIRCIFVDSRKRVWIGTEGGLNLFIPETSSFLVYAKNEQAEGSISDNTVWKICEDEDGILWLATNDGLNSFNPGKGVFTHFKHDPSDKKSLSHNGVRTLLIDDHSRLWVGTQSGLNLYDEKSNSFRRFNQGHGLPNDFIYALEQDYRGDIWISTNKGLACMDYRNFSVKTYDIYDGLQDYEFNTNASCKTRDGELYFGGPGGLNRFNPRKLKPSDVDPNIEITAIRIFDTLYSNQVDVSQVDTLQLDYFQNSIHFEFTSLDFSNPSRNQYSYMMEGFDANWIESADQRQASYTNLDPGEYVFRVRGTNSDGEWSSSEKEVRIIIQPPFWQTAWFYLLCIVLVLVSAYEIYKWRVRSLTREKKILEQKVEERTHDLAQEKQKIEAFNRELEKLSIVASKTDNAVIIADENGVIEWINESFRRMHLHDENYESYYGKTIIETSSNEHMEDIISGAVRDRKSMSYESVSTNVGGTRFVVQSTLTPIFDETGNLRKLVIIDTDITERKKSEEIIREKNKDITDSINYAVRIQQAILPDDNKVSGILPDSFVYYKPKDIVSGDFYFIEHISTNQLEKLAGFAVGDCTGHGVPGAFMSLIANNYLTQSLNEATVNSPGEALDFVSGKIRQAFSKKTDGQAIRDGMDIAFCVFSPKDRNLYYAGANRPLVVISKGALTEIKATPQPVGFHDSHKPFSTHALTVNEGDMVYLFSDGFIDQFGGKNGKKFKYSRFKELLLSICDMSLADQKKQLNQVFMDWKGDLEQLDDICVMGVRIS
jgi:PAS domain S-box-containing protein